MDKAMHFAAGFLVTSVLSFQIPLDFALGVGIASGFMKEIYDVLHPENHTVDILDAAATWIGAGTSYLILMNW